jgi:uncharacterized membrane protein YgcG
MQSKYFNVLLILALLLFFFGVATLYLYARLDAQVPIKQSKYAKLQVEIQSVDCQALNKNAVLLIAQTKHDDIEAFANIFYVAGLIFILIGIVNFAVIYKYLKPNNP